MGSKVHVEAVGPAAVRYQSSLPVRVRDFYKLC